PQRLLYLWDARDAEGRLVATGSYPYRASLVDYFPPACYVMEATVARAVGRAPAMNAAEGPCRPIGVPFSFEWSLHPTNVFVSSTTPTLGYPRIVVLNR